VTFTNAQLPPQKKMFVNANGVPLAASNCNPGGSLKSQIHLLFQGVLVMVTDNALGRAVVIL
jgi:hypothetical protein